MRDSAGTLIESYPRTLYASMGALVAARFHFDRSDLKAAKAQLEWVVERSPSDDFRDIAAPASPRDPLDENAPDEALKLLDAKHGVAYERSTPRCAATLSSPRTSAKRAPPTSSRSTKPSRSKAPSARAYACGLEALGS